MKFSRLLPLLLVFVMLFCSCKPKEEQKPEMPEEPVDPNWPITLEINGELLTLEKAPESIVSLSPAITALFYDMDEDDLLKGVSSYAPAEAVGKEDCGTAQAVDLDAVKSIKPELLLTDTPLLNEEHIQLQQMDVEVLVLPRPESLQDITDRGELLFLALYGKEDGAERGAEFTEVWEKAWQPLEDIGIAVTEDNRKNVVLLGSMDSAATGDSWEGEMLETLGMNNLAADGAAWQIPEKQTAEDGTVTYLYGETVADWMPEVIFYNSNMDVEALKADERYAESPAVVNNMLFPIDWTVLQMQNLKLAELYGFMAEQVYPDEWEMIQKAIAEQEAEEAAKAEAAVSETETIVTEGSSEKTK